MGGRLQECFGIGRGPEPGTPERDRRVAPLTHADSFLAAVQGVAVLLDRDKIEEMVVCISHLRNVGGRLFVLGMGGSAANASHAVNDFRKLCNIEAYCASDNAAEMTARINDDGASEWMAGWLKASNLAERDAILVLSVGGGTYHASQCIVEAVRYAMQCNVLVMGIVGDKDGYTARYGHSVLVLPTPDDHWRTPLAETFQAVIWHLIVNHPALKS